MGPSYPRQPKGWAQSCKRRVELAQMSPFPRESAQMSPNRPAPLKISPTRFELMGAGRRVQKSLLLRGRRGRAERVQALLGKE